MTLRCGRTKTHVTLDNCDTAMGVLEMKEAAAGKYKLDRASPTGWMHRPGPPPVSIPVDYETSTRVKGMPSGHVQPELRPNSSSQHLTV